MWGYNYRLLVKDILEYRISYEERGEVRRGGLKRAHFGSYNTQNGHNGNLESSLHGMDEDNIYL